MVFGSTEIAKGLLGTTLVFQKGAQPQPVEPVPDHACLTFRSSDSNTLSMSLNGTAAPLLYYSTDGTTWTVWDDSALSFSAGHPLFIYGNNTSGFSSSSDNYAKFVMGGTGDVECSGSISTLINGTDTLATIPNNYCFCRLFHNCSVLKTPPSLPSTTLKNYCYYLMFYGCSSLTTAPILPATTMVSHCYDQMFRGCTHLTTAPDLPAVTLATRSYYYMFYGCSRLNYVKAMFTTTPGSNYTYYWLSGVASTGTFVKNSAATWTNTGSSAIPTGWTVETTSS